MIDLDESEYERQRKIIDSAMVMCQAGGCVFTDEELIDYEKVKRGEMTMKDVKQKFMDKIARLRITNPEMFESPR